MAMDKGDAGCTCGLSKEMYDKMKVNAEAKEGYDDLADGDKTNMQNVLKERACLMACAIVEHIVANADVNSVQVSDPVGTVETFAAGVGDHGGALAVPGPIPVSGAVKKGVQTLDQTGTGSIV